MDFIAYGLVVLESKKRFNSLEKINDVKVMHEVMGAEAEYGECISDAFALLSSYLMPARESDELHLEKFDCDEYDPTKVVFLEEEDESWKDHMFGDKISSPFLLEDKLFKNMVPLTNVENVGQAGGIAPWALLPGETEDEPYFVVRSYHPLLEHGYSKHYYFTDSARLWVFATSSEEDTADDKATPKKNFLEEATADKKATPKKNFLEENIPASRKIFLTESNISEEMVSDEIDVITVEDEDRPKGTPPVTNPNKNQKIIRKIPLNKNNQKKRSYDQMVKGEEVDIRAKHNLKEKLRRASLKAEFENLRKCLPSLRQEPKAPTTKIMKESIDYMKYLEGEENRCVKRLKELKFESEELTAQLKEYVI